MNEPTLAVGREPVPTSRDRNSAFHALVCKDLRLVSPVVISFLALVLMSLAVVAVAPLFGPRASLWFGLDTHGGSLWERIGALHWLSSVGLAVATFASALLLAARESGDRSRFLLPTLPVSASQAYRSKVVALLLVFAVFVAFFALTYRSGTIAVPDTLWLAALVAAMSVWAFAAPYFVRGVGAGFVVTLVPVSMFSGTLLLGHWLVPAIVKGAIDRMGLDAAYYTQGAQASRIGVPGLYADTQQLISQGIVRYSFAVMVLLGLWAAWRARHAVLCQQTPRPLSAGRSAKLLLIALSGSTVALSAASGHTWVADPIIRQAVKASDAVSMADRLLSMPTDALVREYSLVLASDNDARESRLEVQNAAYRKMDRKAKQSSGWNLAQVLSTSPASQDHIARAVAVENALSRRRTDDPAGFETTIAGFLAGLERNQIPAWSQLQIAALIGPRTQLSLALKLIAEDPSDIDRVHLVSMIGNDWLIGTIVLADGSARPSVAVPDPLNPFHEFALLGLPPFEPVPWRGFGRTDGAASRISAVVVLAALRQRLEAGTLATVDPVNPIDRLSIDAGILARAREAIERPFTELANDLAIPVPPTGNPALIEWMSDSERLYLRASELFDPAKTDPSYLLPNR